MFPDFPEGVKSKKYTSPPVSNQTGSVTDIDGNIYQTVKIGDQWWMAENLKVIHYRNGDVIPNVTDKSEWAGLFTDAYCNYDNDVNNTNTYGSLYNWYAVNDSRNIAPEGWHVPTDDEWKELEMYLGMSQSEADNYGWRGTNEGENLKEAGTTHWKSPNSDATNASGFNGLPGSCRYDYGYLPFLGYVGYFWSSTENLVILAWYRLLSSHRSGVNRDTKGKQGGLSVRCVKD